MPLALFIAILLAYGRLYVDSEMTVLEACGMSQNRLLGYTMAPALLVGAGGGGLQYLVDAGWHRAGGRYPEPPGQHDRVR